MVCGPDRKMCIYTDNVCNQEVLQISFPHFVWEAECEKKHTAGGEGNVLLNTVSLKKTYCTSCNSGFPTWHFRPRFTCFFGTVFEVFTVIRIHNVVWFRTPCILVHGCEWFGGVFWVFTDSRKMEAVCPDRNISQGTQSRNSEDYYFES
jgi:hypothetical protein